MKRATIVRIADLTGITDRRDVSVFTSLEGENPGGSIKDRMVRGELEYLLSIQAIRPGDKIAELSAGSTALSLAHHAGELKLRSLVFLPAGSPAELIEALREKKTEVRTLPFDNVYERYREAIQKERVHDFNQMFDTAKRRHYFPLAAEIEKSLPPLDALIGAVGTGHSLLGIAAGLGRSLHLASAEPLGAEKIPGVRNIETDRFGPNDPCRPELFAERILVPSAGMFPHRLISTSAGQVEIGPTFQLVLGGIGRLLEKNRQLRTVFAVGAKNRRCRL